MLSLARRATRLVLAPLGLEPGRAVANARVAIERSQQQQAEQYAHIVWRLNGAPRDDLAGRQLR